VKGKDDVVAQAARFHSTGVSALFGVSVGQDEKHSDQYAVHLRQGGLGLPERGYYVDDTPDAKRVRAAYREHVAKMLGLAGAGPDWRTYRRWQLLRSTAPYLSAAIEQEHFRFTSTVLRGVATMQPRWKRVIGTIDRQMGEALGRLYVERYFPPDAKRRMDDLV